MLGFSVHQDIARLVVRTLSRVTVGASMSEKERGIEFPSPVEMSHPARVTAKRQFPTASHPSNADVDLWAGLHACSLPWFTAHAST